MEKISFIFVVVFLRTSFGIVRFFVSRDKTSKRCEKKVRRESYDRKNCGN